MLSYFVNYLLESLCSSPISKYPFYLLIETYGSHMEHDEEKLNNFLKFTMDKGYVVDGITTNEPGKIAVLLFFFLNHQDLVKR